jgi:hypothetical protein
MLGSMPPHPVPSGQPIPISWPRQASRQDCKLLTALIPLQTIHQARAEQANSSSRQIRLASSDERVLPDVKAHLRLQRDSKDSVSSPMYRNERVSFFLGLT